MRLPYKVLRLLGCRGVSRIFFNEGAQREPRAKGVGNQKNISTSYIKIYYIELFIIVYVILFKNYLLLYVILLPNKQLKISNKLCWDVWWSRK